MNQEKQETSAVLMDTIITKMEKQDQRIQAQEKEIALTGEKIKQIPDYSKDMREIKTGLHDLLAGLKKLDFPSEKMQEFSKIFTAGLAMLRQPTQSIVQHHHYVPKIIWVAGGLFLSLCLVCSGWYMTASTLSQYRANDTKYRKIKLAVDSAGLRYLWRLDSIYSADPDKMRSDVTEQERLKQERLELLDQIQVVNGKIEQSAGKAGEKKKNGH